VIRVGIVVWAIGLGSVPIERLPNRDFCQIDRASLAVSEVSLEAIEGLFSVLP
jgi:hypothetical protein